MTDPKKDDNARQEEEMEDDTSSESDGEEPRYTTMEEREGTIPGSEAATAMALAHQGAQGNPVVERGPPKKKKKAKKSKDEKK